MRVAAQTAFLLLAALATFFLAACGDDEGASDDEFRHTPLGEVKVDYSEFYEITDEFPEGDLVEPTTEPEDGLDG